MGPPGPCGCGCPLTPETSLGFSVVEFSRDVLGVEPLPWQRFLWIHALELRPSRRFRFRTVVLLVARQNGKTSGVEIKKLWKLFVLRVRLVIGTAQNLDIAEESWAKALEIIESIPELAAELTHVDRAGGKKTFTLSVPGEPKRRWKVTTPSRKGGRGLSGDDVDLDELREHQTWDAWGAVTKTTMARPNAQVWAESNAGDDKSVVLNDLQKQGRAAAGRPPQEDDSFGYFEWSAPDDVKCTCPRPDGKHAAACRLRDRAAWAQANPALGYTMDEQALLSALETDPEAVFRTECLCQRVPTLAAQWQVIGEEAWNALIDRDAIRPTDMAFAVQVDYRRGHTAIAACGAREDGTLLVSLVEYRPGTQWVADRLLKLRDKYQPVAIAIQDKGPTGSLIDEMAKLDILPPEDPDRRLRGELAVLWSDDVADSYGLFVDAITQERLNHLDEVPLNLALADAGTRTLSNALAWEYKGKTDCSPLLAATFAHWAYVKYAESVASSFEPSAYWI